MMTPFAAALAASLLAAPAEGEPPRDLPDLESLLRAAEDESPLLRAARLDARAARTEAGAAGVLPEPAVELQLGFMELRASAMQEVPWPSRLSRSKDAAGARADALDRRYEALRVSLRRRIRAPWAELAEIAAARDVLADEARLVAEVENTVRARLSVGRASYDALTRAVLRGAEVREELATLADRAERLQAEVRAAAGLAADVGLPAATFERLPDELPRVRDLRERLRENPEVKMAAAEIAMARAEAAVVGTRRLPDFAVGLGWMGPGPAMEEDPSFGEGLMLMTMVRVPLWSSAYDREEDAARARSLAAEARRDAVLLDLDAMLAGVLSRRQEARRKVALYEKELAPAAMAALETALQAYAADRAMLVDLLEIEDELLRYRMGALEAKAMEVMAVADLEALLGSEVGEEVGR